MNEQIIHIQWAGPLPFTEIPSFRGKTDFGIYQVHGRHPIYGSDTLLYLGKAQHRPFGVRLLEEGWAAWEEENGTVSFYLGRLSGSETPTDAVWNEHISRAERLLIYAHRPAHNSSGLNTNNDPSVGSLHVLNWGNRGGLLPEVSGARWSSRFATIIDYAPYGSHNAANSEQDEQLVIRVAQSPRQDWEAQFEAMANAGEDRLLNTDGPAADGMEG